MDRVRIQPQQPAIEDLYDGFAESPEFQAFHESATHCTQLAKGVWDVNIRIMAWPSVMLNAFNYELGITPQQATADQLAEMLFERVPRQCLYTEQDAPELVEELVVLWTYLTRTQRAPHGQACLDVLRAPDTAARIATLASQTHLFSARKHKLLFEMSCESEHGLLQDETCPLCDAIARGELPTPHPTRPRIPRSKARAQRRTARRTRRRARCKACT